MTTSIRSGATDGALQINGVDAVVYNAGGVVSGIGLQAKTLISYGASTTVTSADLGKHTYLNAATAQTITLPAVATCPIGTILSYSNIIGVGSWTLARAGTSTIFALGQASATSITLNPSDSVQLTNDGANWVQVTGSKIIQLGTKSTAFTNATNYLAATDGLVYGFTSSGGTANQITVLSDATTTPSIILQTVGTNTTANNYAIGFSVPVKKGNYWRVDLTSGTVPTLNFMPIGA